MSVAGTIAPISSSFYPQRELVSDTDSADYKSSAGHYLFGSALPPFIKIDETFRF